MKFGLKHALALTALSMTVACGPTDDPSKNSNANNDNNASNQSNEPNNESNEPNNESNEPNNESNEPNNESNEPNNTTSNTPNNTNMNNEPGPCMASDVFFGQADPMANDDHAGGVPSTDPLTTDAGLAGALAMFTAMEDMQQAVDPGIAIAGATVTATSFGDGGNSNFWVEDSGAAMQVRLDFMTPVPVTVKVGDIVSFTITEFDNFDGHPQISMLTDFVVDSSGNPVPYNDLTGMAPTADHYNKIVRIGGRLSATGVECGGSSMCYELTHGTETIEYRTSSTFIEGGECMTFFGPLSGFPGPNADDGSTPKWQLNTNNFTWAFELFE